MTIPPTYNPNYPEVESTWADWQVQFIQNFTQLGLAFAQNHVPLDDPTSANRGNHTYVQMPELLNAPQTGASEFSIHSLNVEDQTDQIFFTYPGNSPVVQFTNYQIYTVPPITTAGITQTTYFTFLPGKILVYFGGFGPFFGPFATPFNIILNPPVAKNIISVQFTLSGSTPDFTPSYTINTWTQTEIITEITLIPNFPQTIPQAVFYMVIANI